MKKFLMCIYCVVLIVVVPIFLAACNNTQSPKSTEGQPTEKEQVYSKWDVNRDGSVNVLDVSELLNIKAYYEAGTATEDQIARGDVNENGSVTQSDVDALYEYLANH